MARQESRDRELRGAGYFVLGDGWATLACRDDDAMWVGHGFAGCRVEEFDVVVLRPAAFMC